LKNLSICEYFSSLNNITNGYFAAIVFNK
jgi:hypothetical protein